MGKEADSAEYNFTSSEKTAIVSEYFKKNIEPNFCQEVVDHFRKQLTMYVEQSDEKKIQTDETVSQDIQEDTTEVLRDRKYPKECFCGLF